jgi:hypothetical protein
MLEFESSGEKNWPGTEERGRRLGWMASHSYGKERMPMAKNSHFFKLFLETTMVVICEW